MSELRYSELYVLLGLDVSFDRQLDILFSGELASVPITQRLWLNRQSLAFLGDAVLECIVREQLILFFPASLSDQAAWRGSICSNYRLASIARTIGLEQYLPSTNHQHSDRYLGTLLEALFGLISLRLGSSAAKAKILPIVMQSIRRAVHKGSQVMILPRQRLSALLAKHRINHGRYKTREAVQVTDNDWENVIELHIAGIGTFVGQAKGPIEAMDRAAYGALAELRRRNLS